LSIEPEWLVPASLEEALALRAERREGATVVAGGTFVGILVNSRLLAPEAFLSLQRLAELDYVHAGGDLRLGALATHRTVERSPVVREGWPALAHAFSVVASPRVRNQATVGGVLADADYASDPPSMFLALGARAVVSSVRGVREVPIEDLITGFNETSL
jgi:carbon-monoxide dehydrogenase medium subunit